MYLKAVMVAVFRKEIGTHKAEYDILITIVRERGAS